MKKRLLITDTARKDLKKLTRESNRTWGKDQTRSYVARLRSRFQSFRDYPELGTARDDIRPGYRLFPEGSHVI